MIQIATLFFIIFLQLKTRLPDNFTCTERELIEVSSAIKVYILVRELRSEVRDLLFQEGLRCFSTRFESAFWNSHVLGNCSAYESLSTASPVESDLDRDLKKEAEDLAYIQDHILQPTYNRFVRGNASFCEIP